MIKIECNEKEVKGDDSHVEVNFFLEAHSRNQVKNEVAAAISAMFQKIPRDLFLEGLMDSDLGEDVMKKTKC